jgi:hypothetical protein
MRNAPEWLTQTYTKQYKNSPSQRKHIRHQIDVVSTKCVTQTPCCHISMKGPAGEVKLAACTPTDSHRSSLSPARHNSTGTTNRICCETSAQRCYGL